MRVCLVHPSPLTYSKLYLRLEPLGLEIVAQALLEAGHEIRLIDLQVFDQSTYFAELDNWRPEAIGFSLNYLANVPEVINLAKATKAHMPSVFIFVGGHSVSFIAQEVLEHAGGSIDCVVCGEGEAIVADVINCAWDQALKQIPGVVTLDGNGPPLQLFERIDLISPARALLRKRNKYFIGALEPCASIEFTRGCPWDCSFCSAWTFYNRTYRKKPAELVAEELSRIEEPYVFIVDDVAFVHPEDGMRIADEIERRGIHKEYYLETRCDVLIRNQDVFKRWKKLGLRYMFLGLEAIDDEGLQLHRKRITPSENFKALEIARELGILVAVNIITDPVWDTRRFEYIREWAETIPEIVNLTIATPYPGTELWLTESRKFTTMDYRLFDIVHAVLPTKLPLDEFYKHFVKTQTVLYRKYLGIAALRDNFAQIAKNLLRGQTNFLEILWKFGQVHEPGQYYQDHFQEIEYTMRPPPSHLADFQREELYVHKTTESSKH
jgi:hopanoid C-3 methylase HpnR